MAPKVRGCSSGSQRSVSLWSAEAQPGPIEVEVFGVLDTNGDQHLSFEEMIPLINTQARVDAVKAHLSRCRNQAGLSLEEFAAAFQNDENLWCFYQKLPHGTLTPPEVQADGHSEVLLEQEVRNQVESRTPKNTQTPKKTRDTPRGSNAESSCQPAPSWGPEEWPNLPSSQNSVQQQRNSIGSLPTMHETPKRQRRRSYTGGDCSSPVPPADALQEVEELPSQASKFQKSKTPRHQRNSVGSLPTAHETPKRQRRRSYAAGDTYSSAPLSVDTLQDETQQTPQRGRHQSTTAEALPQKSGNLHFDLSETQPGNRCTSSSPCSQAARSWLQVPPAQPVGLVQGPMSMSHGHMPMPSMPAGSTPGFNMAVSGMPINSTVNMPAAQSPNSGYMAPQGSASRAASLPPTMTSMVPNMCTMPSPQMSPPGLSNPMASMMATSPMSPGTPVHPASAAPPAQLQHMEGWMPTGLPMPQIYQQAPSPQQSLPPQQSFTPQQAPPPQQNLPPQQSFTPQQPTNQPDAALLERLMQAEAEIQRLHSHYRAENRALHNHLGLLKKAASPEEREALRQMVETHTMPGPFGGQAWTPAALQNPCRTAVPAPLFTRARRNSRLAIINPRTGEEVVNFFNMAEDAPEESQDEAEAPEKVEDTAPEKVKKALNLHNAWEVLGGVMLEHTNGVSWDWPLSRTEKKERVLMINQLTLLTEIQQLRDIRGLAQDSDWEDDSQAECESPRSAAAMTEGRPSLP